MTKVHYQKQQNIKFNILDVKCSFTDELLSYSILFKIYINVLKLEVRPKTRNLLQLKAIARARSCFVLL